MPKRKQPADKAAAQHASETELRIIGGKFRASKLSYVQLEREGDLVTRPMKHRVREAIFNLVGFDCKGRHAIDMFAGTGALGLEAISRGATSAIFIERHIPTARVVRKNIASLGLESCCELLETSAFLWAKRDLPTKATTAGDSSSSNSSASDSAAKQWLVFISPPFDFFVDRQQEMLGLIAAVAKHAPAGSTIVVESDQRFDFGLLPEGVKLERDDPGWDVRTYAPAVVGVLRT